MAGALVAALFVVRVAFVEAFATKDPTTAAAVWADHPAVLLETGLARVGDMAAAGRPVDPALVGRLISASAKAPLAPEPFLVRGVNAQISGNQAVALQSYLAARERNPRAVAPRYFLADLYLKAGQTERGLAEISVLSRLVPQSLPNVAKYLAAYARTPGAAPQVKKLLETHPQLELALLNELAGDAAGARLVLYLWSGRGGEEARPWQGRLLEQLVGAGRFNEARSAWARFTNIRAKPDSLFDAQFEARALPPFGWMLASGPSGIAEPQGVGRLHLIYYGRDDLALASQLLTLPPGRYRLSMKVSASSAAAKSLSATVRCLPSSNPLASLPLHRPGVVTASFAVAGQGCAAQRLNIVGDAPEFPERAETTVSELRLQRDAGQ